MLKRRRLNSESKLQTVDGAAPENKDFLRFIIASQISAPGTEVKKIVYH